MDAQQLAEAIRSGEICLCGKSVCDGLDQLQSLLDQHADELAEKVRALLGNYPHLKGRPAWKDGYMAGVRVSLHVLEDHTETES